MPSLRDIAKEFEEEEKKKPEVKPEKEETKYKCPECSKEYSSQGWLDRHISEEHTKKSKEEKIEPEELKLKQKENMFQDLADSTEFKRFIYRLWFGKTHRGTSKELEAELRERKALLKQLTEDGL
jgi:transcription elongation factor Elf1